MQQKAMIVWNGEIEMLYLTTDLNVRGGFRTDLSDLKAVEIMPLPSMPDIKLADEKTFKRLNELLREKRARMSFYGLERSQKEGGGLGVGEDENVPGVYVEFHSMVGIHNITVVRVENTDGFMIWLERYFREIKGDNYTIPEGLSERIQHYLNYDINYFSLDIVDLSTQYYYATMSVPPVVYTFNTTKLYYPMYISAGGDTWGEVRLFIITDQELSLDKIERHGFNVDDVLPLSREELREINETAAKLTLRRYLQIYVVTAYVDYSRFHPDLYMKSEGVYQPPLMGAGEIVIVLSIFLAAIAVMYALWRRAVRK